MLSNKARRRWLALRRDQRSAGESAAAGIPCGRRWRFLAEHQELAVARGNLTNLIALNNGYASIRMTQKTYFRGAWLGCDTESGLGFPDWPTCSAVRHPSADDGPRGRQRDHAALHQ